MDILHWTEGQGTGHIKRINALLRRAGQENSLKVNTPSSYLPKSDSPNSHAIKTGANGAALAHFDGAPARSAGNIRYWVRAEDPKFHSLLPKHVLYWDGVSPEKFDLIVLDLEDELIATDLASRSDKWIQLCRIGTPLNLPIDIETHTQRISFENCREHQRLGIPYFGALLDASPEDVYTRDEAREQLKALANFSDMASIALTHANSADSQAAYDYLLDATQSLLARHDHVFVATGHPQCQHALRSAFVDKAVTVCSMNPIYTFYPAFDALIAPMGYNTYHEVGLFFPGEREFRPMYPPDQALRKQEMPIVDHIGNKAIFNFITDAAARH